MRTKKARRAPWYPTQAKTGLEWGTQRWLPVQKAGSMHRPINYASVVIPTGAKRGGGICGFIARLSLLIFLVCPGYVAAQQSASFSQVETLVQQGQLEKQRAKCGRSCSGIRALMVTTCWGLSKAINRITKALSAHSNRRCGSHPTPPKRHNNLGNVYVAQKKFDLAEKEFRTVLRLDPANRDAHYNLGVMLMAKGSPAEAIPHFERVRPADLPTSLNLVRALLESKRTAEALRMATEISDQHKNEVQVHFSLGVLLASEKQYKPAEVELEKAEVLQPGTFEIPYNLGQVFLRSGAYPQAELALNRALKQKPDSPETLSAGAGPGG